MRKIIALAVTALGLAFAAPKAEAEFGIRFFDRWVRADASGVSAVLSFDEPVAWEVQANYGHGWKTVAHGVTAQAHPSVALGEPSSCWLARLVVSGTVFRTVPGPAGACQGNSPTIALDPPPACDGRVTNFHAPLPKGGIMVASWTGCYGERITRISPPGRWDGDWFRFDGIPSGATITVTLLGAEGRTLERVTGMVIAGPNEINTWSPSGLLLAQGASPETAWAWEGRF